VLPLALIWRNLWRNPLRSGLTLASVAASLFLFTLLRGLVDSMRDVAGHCARELRLVVHHRTSMTHLLPLGHGTRLAGLPGVRAVCAVRWFGGRLENSPEQFPSLAAEPRGLEEVYSDFDLAAEELEQWRHRRAAAIVGAELAARCGWQPGRRVTLRGSIPPYPAMEFEIVAITQARGYGNLFVLRLDYLLDVIRAANSQPAYYADSVNFFWVKARDLAALDALSRLIDELFSRSDAPTRTEPEHAFVAQFTRMFGDIPTILEAVGLIVIASILLAILNTTAIALRERTGELAVLRAIGYSQSRLLAATLAESTLLGYLGGLIGVLAAWAVAGGSTTDGLSIPYFPVVSVSPVTALIGLAAGTLAGLLAGFPPARHVARLPVSCTLRGAV